MKLDHFLKGPLTSILGIMIMAISSWLMMLGKLEVLWDGCALILIGFSILFLKDELPSWIRKYFTKKLK